MVGSALAFGGVTSIGYSLLEVALFLGILVLLVHQTRMDQIKLFLPRWPALFVLWVLLELVPLPQHLVYDLEPGRGLDPARETFVANGAAWGTLSFYPHGTLLALVKFLAFLVAFMLAAEVFDYRKRSSGLVRTLIFLGLFEAGYGIVQYLTGWQKIFTFRKQYDLEEATGTYINRNHFSGLLELIIPFVIAAIYYSYQNWSEYRYARSDAQAHEKRSSSGFQAIFYFFLLVIIMVALIFSRSRAGITTAAFTIMFVALLAQVRTRRKAWGLGLFLFLMCVLAYGLWIGLGPVLARFEQVREPGYLRMEGRMLIWKDAYHLARDYPLTGTGLGTFEVAFRPYQTSLVNNVVDHAHNDYIEFASETGLPGASLLFFPIFYLLGRMLVSFLDDPRRYRRAVTLGCIGSTVALLIHSVTDFNLQVPANALVFAVILGIGYRAVCIDRRREERARMQQGR